MIDRTAEQTTAVAAAQPGTQPIVQPNKQVIRQNGGKVIANINALIRESFFYRILLFFLNEAGGSFFFRTRFEPKLITLNENYRGGIVFGFFQNLLSFSRISGILTEKARESVFLTAVRGVRDRMRAHPSFFVRLIANFRLLYLVMLYPVIAYATRHLVFGGRFASIWDEALMLLLAGAVFYRIVMCRKIWKTTVVSHILVFFMMISVFLLMAESPNFGIGVEGLRAVVQYMSWFFLVIQLIDDEKDVNILIGVGSVSAVLIALHAIYQYAAKVPMLGNWVDATEVITTRAYSILLSPNLLGAFFELFLPVSVAYIFAARTPFVKLLSFLSCVLLSLGLLFTFSRGAWLAAFVGIVFFLLMTYRKLLIPMMLSLTAFLFAVPKLGDRIFRLFSTDYFFRSAKGGRIYRLEESLNIWSKSPLFGLGFGRFGGAVAMNHRLSPFYTDNYYLKTLVETGIVGLTSFVALLASLVFFSVRSIRSVACKRMQIVLFGLLSGQIAVIAHNLTENIFESPALNTLFWLFSAIIIAYPTVAPRASVDLDAVELDAVELDASIVSCASVGSHASIACDASADQEDTAKA